MVNMELEVTHHICASTMGGRPDCIKYPLAWLPVINLNKSRCTNSTELMSKNKQIILT